MRKYDFTATASWLDSVCTIEEAKEDITTSILNLAEIATGDNAVEIASAMNVLKGLYNLICTVKENN